MDMIPPWMDGVAFTAAEARAMGLSDSQLRNERFERPHHGVRLLGLAGRVDGGLIDRCSDLRVVLPKAAVYSHATAAELWGMPLPGDIGKDLHVLVPGVIPVRRPGVVAWTRSEDWPSTDLVNGMPVTSPADTWAALAAMSPTRGGGMTREWLVAVGDFLLSGKRTRTGREPALATREQLIAAIVRHGSRRGAAALQWAVGRVRQPVDSPPETFLRLGLLAARLPEPSVQPAIPTTDGVRHPDLGYLPQWTLLEYLGDVHRTDRDTWRKDLTRVQLFQDAGYDVILVGADDITAEAMPALAARVRRALHRRR